MRFLKPSKPKDLAHFDRLTPLFFKIMDSKMKRFRTKSYCSANIWSSKTGPERDDQKQFQ